MFIIVKIKSEIYSCYCKLNRVKLLKNRRILLIFNEKEYQKMLN